MHFTQCLLMKLKKRKGLLSVENERRNIQICLLSNGDQFYTIFSQFEKEKKQQLETETDYFLILTIHCKNIFYSVLLSTFPVHDIPCFVHPFFFFFLLN